MDEEQVLMINDCLKRKQHLTDWEIKFMQNLHGDMTEEQSYILNHVWERVT